MSKRFVRKLFDRWFAENLKNFRYPPRIIERGKDYFVFKFAGITPHLRCIITEHGTVDVYVVYRRRHWDIIASFDVYEKRTRTGRYYCSECITRSLFASREKLWITHSLAPLLAWAREQLRPSQWLCLFGLNGITCAQFHDVKDIPPIRRRKSFVYACPVVEAL
jgi:hypothetical protein